MPKLGWNLREDVKKEVQKALKKMKSGKAPGVDGIACEMLKAKGSYSNRLIHTSGKCMYEWTNSQEIGREQ